ncbi:MAG TPA: uridine diphosphate-N-acetylglucosamine-binding protein YvcK [Beutenbergiaceae bacterium]|nr:uridine diphosphate-N-acetylglucosamine-binding protein YvcK [Beutenbergiaceae bacterium]
MSLPGSTPPTSRPFARRPGALKVAALGGGHGLAATLRALRHVTSDVTAVVTVADDGGSSGRLRQELGVLPPGDLRMALTALCDDSDWGYTWRDVLQHRFRSEGPLDGHALGNLLIVTLWELLGNEVAGLDWVGRLLGAQGRVLPMAAVPLEIQAEVKHASGQQALVRGQSRVAVTSGQVQRVRLVPQEPPACAEAVASIRQADFVVLGPGSWFTSVMPHLLVPEIAEALHQTRARIVLTLNLSAQRGETEGYSAADHLRSLHDNAPDLRVDTVIADPTAIEELDDLRSCTARTAGRLLLRQVGLGDGSPYHDPLRLAAAYRDAFEGFLGDVGERSE